MEINVQIIIPMSGFGERFRRAGYSVPKPLIEIEGKPIVAHVIDMFPGETDFIFICNQDHLDHGEYHMAQILQQYCPTGQIIGIAPHKFGPIHAVLQVLDQVKVDSPVVVNYCDFTCYWDWGNFKKFAVDSGAAGIIPAYRGFHPHTLGTTNYAYLRENNEWAVDIQEKKPYTDNRMEEYASSGTYYFATGALMANALAATVEQDLSLNGEYYVSLAYKFLFEKQLPVAIYPLQHFMQWGTPGDVAEYNEWSNIFKRLLREDASSSHMAGHLVVPMAGLGQRFAKEGYQLTKPLIPVSGRPMVMQATHDLPVARRPAYVLRTDMPGVDAIISQIRATYPAAVIATVPAVTEGQASTALVGLKELSRQSGQAIDQVTFGACDNGMLYDHQAYEALANNPDVDVIVWGVRQHTNAARYPHMYGWIDAVDGNIREISVKVPLGHPEQDPIVIGTFTFRRGEDFVNAVARLIARDGRVNGEFYIDSCINDALALGLRCKLFEVENFISWGTPNDLKTFEYWQSCFHKWAEHPYRLQLDSRVCPDALEDLEARYAALVPVAPVIPA
jgi:NDP-sugar pyrophosphorylase family protein